MVSPRCPYLGPVSSATYPPGSPSPRPHFSYEFFPPLTQPGTLNLHDRIHRMAALGPTAISVTWGAGGSTSGRSLGLAKFVAEEVKGGKHAKDPVECILHLTCTNMGKSMVVAALDKAKELGIRNILALRGDPPRDDEYSTEPVAHDKDDQLFVYAIDLVRFIRENYGDFFCIGVAGYPDRHPDSPTAAADVAFLKDKVDAGADFIITQLFYDVDVFLAWQKSCREAGITIPIVPGVMPIQNYASFRRMTNLCKASVPQQILEDLEPIKHDDNLVKSYGVELAIKMVHRLVEDGKVEGVHFCTLNLEKSVRRVLDGLKWANFEDASSNVNGSLTNGAVHANFHNALIEDASNPSTLQSPSSLIVSPAAASLGANIAHAHSHQHLVPSAPNAPKQEGDSWDEFPNGRFTDTRSPAYGELDGYGAGLKILPQEALTTWGTPTSARSISDLFTSYLLHQTPSIPWCPTPLDKESEAILPLLLKLNSPEVGWWTVGSQPAVDGAKSEDEVYGFGPRGGYVFQKPFVELFVNESVVKDIEHRAKAADGLVTFYAGNKKGDAKTNMSSEDVNAVTWAIFPGQEIVQSTIIDEVSFHSWREEAFSIWQDWSYLYPVGSPSRKLLQDIGEEMWLVSIVHHDYKDPDALGRFLLEDRA